MREAVLRDDRRSRGAAPRERAEALAALLPPLLVAALHVASTVAQGVYGRRRVGRGEAFWQFRRYSPGDPLRGIDWRRSAKSDALYVREKEWEAALTVWLWRDASPSMDYRSSRDLPEKRERAELLLLALAALLLRGGERVALLGGNGPMGGQAALSRLAESLLSMPAADESQADPAAASLPPVTPLPRHARAVLISDFLAPLPKIAAAVRALAAGSVACHLVQVLDPAEETLPFHGRIRFEGMEGEPPVLVSRAESLRTAYAERMAARRAALLDLALRSGGSFAVHHTDRPPQIALLALYEAMAQSPAGYRPG